MTSILKMPEFGEKPGVDLEVNTSNTQKSEFYEA